MSIAASSGSLKMDRTTFQREDKRLPTRDG